jgi:hypothetical protein
LLGLAVKENKRVRRLESGCKNQTTEQQSGVRGWGLYSVGDNYLNNYHEHSKSQHERNLKKLHNLQSQSGNQLITGNYKNFNDELVENYFLQIL